MHGRILAGNLRIDHMVELSVFSQHLSVSRAADELKISPSALSKHLAEMEESFGFPLINRGSKMTLTPAGREIADFFSSFVTDYGEICRRSEMLSKIKSVVLRFEETPLTAGSADVYGVLSDFVAQFPLPVHLRLVPLLEKTSMEAVSEGIIDVGMHYSAGDEAALRAEADRKDVGLFHLGEERLVVWGRADNPLLKGRDSLDLDDLRRVHIMAPASRQYRDAFPLAYRSVFEALGLDLKLDLRSADRFFEFIMLDPRDSVYLIIESALADPVLKMRTDMRFCEVNSEAFKENKYLAYSLKSENPLVDDLIDYFEKNWQRG